MHRTLGVVVLIALVAGVFGTVAPAQADTALNKVQQTEMLKAHNQWRQKVGVAPLQWSAELADTAKGWAEHLRDAQGCRPSHSQSDYGENIFWASPKQWSDGRRELQPVSPSRVVDSWASERSDYNYETNRCAPSKECGHYTQLVARRSTELGCGMASCPDYSQVWVCNYHPIGNIVAEKPY